MVNLQKEHGGRIKWNCLREEGFRARPENAAENILVPAYLGDLWITAACRRIAEAVALVRASLHLPLALRSSQDGKGVACRSGSRILRSLPRPTSGAQFRDDRLECAAAPHPGPLPAKDGERETCA